MDVSWHACKTAHERLELVTPSSRATAHQTCGLSIWEPVFAGVQGLCLGILIGAASTDACFFLLMWRTDWNLEAEKAAERVGVKSATNCDGVALQHVLTSDISETDGRFALEDNTAETTGLLTAQDETTQQSSGQLS